jgi:Domain of unknown function (DUF4410)
LVAPGARGRKDCTLDHWTYSWRRAPRRARATVNGAELSRRVGAEIAKDLVADLQGMGLPVVLAKGQPPPRVNDIVIRGYFVSVDLGSATERVLLGFGAGDAEVHAAVEGYQMTAQGLRPLGRGQIRSGGGDMPGMVLPIAVVAATANPIGLIVGGAVKATGEATGESTIEGTAKRTADAIAGAATGSGAAAGLDLAGPHIRRVAAREAATTTVAFRRPWMIAPPCEHRALGATACAAPCGAPSSSP